MMATTGCWQGWEGVGEGGSEDLLLVGPHSPVRHVLLAIFIFTGRRGRIAVAVGA